MTDCLNFSIEEIDPDRFIGAGREDIDNTAAHSIFPGLAHRISTVIGIGGEKSCQIGRC